MAVDKKHFDKLMGKLDELIVLVGLGLVKDCKNQSERIRRLYDLKLEPARISKILNVKRNIVTKEVSRARKKPKESKKASLHEGAKNRSGTDAEAQQDSSSDSSSSPSNH